MSEYLLTPTAREIANQIISGVTSSTGPRSWSITGPYGTGKSAFALFMTDLLANKQPLHNEARALKDELHFNGNSFLPIHIIGQRKPLALELMHSLEVSFTFADVSLDNLTGINTASKNFGREVVYIFENAAQIANESGYHGMLIIIDEFGKFLEFAAQHPEIDDLFLLQDLAEMSARSKVPIVVLTILHSAFTDYLNVLEEARRVEWQKVQGRFADIAFLEPPEQFLRLIGAALEWTIELPSNYVDAIDTIIRTSALIDVRQRLPIQELVPACLPLHPITAMLLWPLFRSKLAQNERTLFAFLLDRSPYGFQEFLSITPLDNTDPRLYGIDRLYDYVTSTLGTTVLLGDRSRHWAEIEQAINRLSSGAPPLASSVIKAIGLLDLYGGAVGLKASKDILKLSLDSQDQVSTVITYLESISIIVYRRYENAYALWEGSDVDLEACYQDGLQHVGHGKLATRLLNIVKLRPLVAKAHYIITGTLRFFNISIIDGEFDSMQTALNEPVEPADGKLIFVISYDPQERERLIVLAQDFTSKSGPIAQQTLLAFPKPMVGLETALLEAEVWTWIGENIQALQGDPVARKEVKARRDHAQRKLISIAGDVFGLQGGVFKPESSDWIKSGVRRNPTSTLEFQRWLSSLCDDIFQKSPKLHNELLNREKISSAAAAARRNLIQAMIEHEAETNLGITGTPAELSMYRSLLVEGKFHCQHNGVWRFDEPTEAWETIWRAMKDFLKNTANNRRPLPELIVILKKPPFGMREGPIPVLLCAFFLVYREQIALYEEGLFVPELRIEVLERLMRNPDDFEIQRIKISGLAKEVYIALGKSLSNISPFVNLPSDPVLLDVIKPFILYIGRLPDYSKKTKRIEPASAIVVRDLILNARDPLQLLFIDLPKALGVPLEKPEDVQKFARELQTRLDSLSKAYDHLLDEIEIQLCSLFDLQGSSISRREQLKKRAQPLDSYAIDRNLALFVKEASRLDDGRDWREVLGRVVNNGVPPSHWHDRDVVDFQMRLRRLFSDFVRLEELVTEQYRTGISRILRIGILNGQLDEARAIIAVSPDQNQEVDALAGRIFELLDQKTERTDFRIQLAALTKVLERYLHSNGRIESDE